ncbi:heme ABC transporter permease/ATP-binding protein CydD [Shewanella pneumatophori]|uniref:Cysteine/glutathione ABC transporter permease/ATP-binding protein CydD n=1 Tax=Shewanella pneumatophori TaxID=314092 RepID=A0A9X2CGK6_9GAMM|nr:cysteine/glutathione ABC transporter permease/ATP-binding protein CydD [Shewanella pneumatophori]MCL1137569.1 cysteine/glutathione ABC transporter permease/ATP-binding protein CydD [Shewanella pneumatophori]
MDKTVEKKLTKWLKLQKKACGFYLNLSVFFGVLTGLSLMCQAWLIATVLQGIIIDELPKSDFINHFWALLALTIVRGILAFARERASFQAGAKLRVEMRAAVLDKLALLGPAFIKGKPAGSWASIVLEQVEDLQDFYARYLPQVVLAGFIPLIILVAVFPINWAAGLILLATAPLIPMFMILVGMGAADANRKNFSALARLSGHFMDRLKGLSTLKLFNQGEKEARVIKKASEEFRERTMAVLRMAFLSSAVLEFFAAVSIAVMAVYFGFSYLHHLDFGHYGAPISLFTGLFVLILAPEFYQPLRDMGTHYHAKAQAIGAAEELMALLDHPTEQVGGDKLVDGAVTIEAKDLSVYSLDGSLLLGPISFQIGAHEHVAVVGPSGAGKTSLLNALLGFLPYQGQLLIAGTELKDLSASDWRKHLAWLGQEPQLFHGTLRDNVAMGRQLSDEQIMALLSKAQIVDFVEQQAQGLDYPIQEQTAGLSVGQAQRIALARALAQQASLFVLDEPTASLDSLSEQAVQATLITAMQGKACIMVTHRLESLSTMDNILVIDKGALVQQGSYTVLLEQEGTFKQMLDEASSVSEFDIDADTNINSDSNDLATLAPEGDK